MNLVKSENKINLMIIDIVPVLLNKFLEAVFIDRSIWVISKLVEKWL